MRTSALATPHAVLALAALAGCARDYSFLDGRRFDGEDGGRFGDGSLDGPADVARDAPRGTDADSPPGDGAPDAPREAGSDVGADAAADVSRDVAVDAPPFACDLSVPTCPTCLLAGAIGRDLLEGSTDGRPDLFQVTGACDGVGMGGLPVIGAAPDVSVRWVAPRADTYVFSTVGSAFDTVLYVLAYGDAGCAGAQLACDDDLMAIGSTQSCVALSLAAGEAVTVVVDGYASTDHGHFALSITPLADGACP